MSLKQRWLLYASSACCASPFVGSSPFERNRTRPSHSPKRASMLTDDSKARSPLGTKCYMAPSGPHITALRSISATAVPNLGNSEQFKNSELPSGLISFISLMTAHVIVLINIDIYIPQENGLRRTAFYK